MTECMIHHSGGVNRGTQQGRNKESHIENLLDIPITIHLKEICFHQHTIDFDPNEPKLFEDL